MELRRLKGLPGAINEALDAIFLRLGLVACIAIEFLGPERVPRSLLFIEQSGIKDGVERHFPMIASENASICVEGCNQLLNDGELIGRHRAGLVDDHDVGELDLFDQQPDEPACVIFAKGLPAISQKVRSEEHTSELQSLMRLSYAVFCLKKKNTYEQT